MAQPLNNFNKSKPKSSGNNTSTNPQLPGLDNVAPKNEATPPKSISPKKSEPTNSTKSIKNVSITTPKKVVPSTAAIVDFVSHAVAQTQRAGECLGQLLELGDIILLEGELGAGKTSLTKGIAKGVGVGGYVNSPTFTLVNEYRNGRLPIYHLDCYRLESGAEALDFGIEEYLYGDGVTIIEWPQRIAEILPAEHLRIKLGYLADTKRSIRLEPTGTRYIQLVADFKKTAFGA